jgi:hypothetical protein
MRPRLLKDGVVRPRFYTLGCDLGQLADQTELALIETEATRRCYRSRSGELREGEVEAIEHRLRLVERLPVGMNYVLQAEYIRGRLSDPALRGRDVDLVVDATGLGKPIVDILKAAGLRPVPVTITGGMEVTRTAGGGWGVPKELLVNRASASLHSGELVFPEDLEDANGYKRELQDFQVSFTAAGHLTWNARPGAHDDRVLATALAVWWGQRRGRGEHQIRQVPLLGV